MKTYRFRVVLLLWSLLSTLALVGAQEPEFQLAPAISLEAEDFTIERGWGVLKYGENYMVDQIGFSHISGERLLGVDAANTDAVAVKDVTVPVAGDYRLWVRYEYPPFTEARFVVQVAQGGKTLAEMTMGQKDNKRWVFGDPVPKAQHDPSWGPEGMADEVLDVKGLQAGPARITLRAATQPQVPGRAAGRHIDLLYLTSDTKDAWMPHYRKTAPLYPILQAFRDSLGPLYEVQITNKGDKASTFAVSRAGNRWPFYPAPQQLGEIKPGAQSEWIGLKDQDTTHSSMMTISSRAAQPFEVALRPVGGAAQRTFAAEDNTVRFFLPPYPGKGETAVTAIEEIDATLKLLAARPAPGKAPTLPLTYGGWMPLGFDNAYSRKYAELFAAIGLRANMGTNGGKPETIVQNLKRVGIEPNQSWGQISYRNPPLPGNIEAAKKALEKNGMAPYLKWYDYGDEIAFSEWVNMAVSQISSASDGKEKPDEVRRRLWREWLAKNRPGFTPAQYWLKTWGAAPSVAELRPDSSDKAAAENPHLYVDSLHFYEQTAIGFVAQGRKNVKAAFGDDVLAGANYTAAPWFYPTVPMYVTWFRDGAADFGRHSEYFWQLDQAGPLVNGYIAEHFRAGMRNNPQAIHRQYTMPHSPGNTDANFLRTAFTHLAHGAKMLDFFGIGMNESFTENYIDHRDHERYRSIRDITYSIGLVEDIWLQSKVVPSPVAMLLSDSTERWDLAGIARDAAGHELWGGDFRKARLTYHQERVGIYSALTFAGATPDLMVEADLKPEVLRGYKVLYVTGDSMPVELVPALEQWVQSGGVLLATAGGGQFGTYREPNPAMQKLLGIATRNIEERTTFIRPRSELPFLSPLSTLSGDGWKTNQLATWERITPAPDAQVVATFDDGKPAAIMRTLGTGRVYYVAALPGLAYVWSALQPPQVPDRGRNVHTVPVGYDEGAARLLSLPLKAAAVEPMVSVADNQLIDTRLITAPGAYILPVANYNREIGQPVTLSVRVDGPVKKITSAYHGNLPIKLKGGKLQITIPKLGYGDIVRIER